MPEWLLNTPVAFFIFNRPDTTARVFAEIARARPPKLFVIADGPRPDRPDEAARCAAARALIQRVDWKCEVLTDYAAENLGCRRRVSSGLAWVFSQVPEAIILEDDCLPHPGFFRFCEELLGRYRNDPRISQINGSNFNAGPRLTDDSYYFSRYAHIWGWATWRDRMADYDVALSGWPALRGSRALKSLFSDPVEEKFWTRHLDWVHQGKIDTWDYQWFFACLLQGRLAVQPNRNLITNIGFTGEATHTHQISPLANLPAEEMSFPLQHPVGLFQCRELDEQYFQTHLVFSTRKLRWFYKTFTRISRSVREFIARRTLT